MTPVTVCNTSLFVSFLEGNKAQLAGSTTSLSKYLLPLQNHLFSQFESAHSQVRSC